MEIYNKLLIISLIWVLIFGLTGCFSKSNTDEIKGANVKILNVYQEEKTETSGKEIIKIHMENIGETGKYKIFVYDYRNNLQIKVDEIKDGADKDAEFFLEWAVDIDITANKNTIDKIEVLSGQGNYYKVTDSYIIKR